MKNVKWWCTCTLAIAFGMLVVVSCHDKDDDPTPEEGEVVETPEPVVEYYIMGTVTSAGEGLNGVKVKVGDKDYVTDSEGKFSVIEGTTGTYPIAVVQEGYLSQNTSVVIAENAENRSVVTVAVALTKASVPQPVSVDEAAEKVVVKDNSESNEDIKKPEEVEPDKVVEDRPLTTVEIEIPGGAIDTEASAGVIDEGKVNISVTTFVPAPEKVTTEVKPSEENKEVEKSIPLAAAQFEPSGLKFKDPVTISIPNPIPGVTFGKDDMLLTYLNPATGNWDVVKKQNSAENVEVSLGEGKYMAPVMHFSAYAIENKVTSTISQETVQKAEVLGQANRDNSENPKAVSGIVLKYTEKSGWEYEGNIVATVRQQLGAGSSDADTKTVNAMVAYLKTRMFSLMGSVSGIASTERNYNTVNVNGYTKMDYTCYPKVRTTTLTTKVNFNNSTRTIKISAKRYTGTDHQYKTVTYSPVHSGGQGGTH